MPFLTEHQKKSRIIRWFCSTSGLAFTSTIVLGFFVHLYIYVNLYLGHDASLLHNHYFPWDVATGRYTGFLAKILHGYMQTPWLIGVIVLAAMGFSSILICKTLNIEDSFFAILTSAVIISWPTLVSIHCYLYMSSQFALGIFTSCLAAFLSSRYKYGFLVSIPIIVVSMACYQAYWGLSASLLLLYLIRGVLIGHPTTNLLFSKMLSFLIALLLGFLLYYGIWMFFIHVAGFPGTTYLGMDNLGNLSLRSWLSVIRVTYKEAIAFFIIPGNASYYPPLVMTAGWASLFISSIVMINTIVAKKIYKNMWNILILFVCIILMPAAINCVKLFSQGEHVTVLGKYAFISPFLLMITLVGSLTKNMPKTANKQLLKTVCLLVCAFVFTNGFYGANVTYLSLQTSYHLSISTTTQILSRIQSEPNYTADTPVAIVGHAPAYNKDGFDWSNDIAGAYTTSLTYKGPIEHFFRMLSPEINIHGNAEYFMELDVVKNSDPFPSHNCVIWVEGTLVIKISDW